VGISLGLIYILSGYSNKYYGYKNYSELVLERSNETGSALALTAINVSGNIERFRLAGIAGSCPVGRFSKGPEHPFCHFVACLKISLLLVATNPFPYLVALLNFFLPW
jgi:hypothetical protein